jgi:hypothetical protein
MQCDALEQETDAKSPSWIDEIPRGSEGVHEPDESSVSTSGNGNQPLIGWKDPTATHVVADTHETASRFDHWPSLGDGVLRAFQELPAPTSTRPTKSPDRA